MWITILMCVFNWREEIRIDVCIEYRNIYRSIQHLQIWSSRRSKIGKENPEGLNGTRLISLTISKGVYVFISDGEEGNFGQEIKHNTDTTNQITQRGSSKKNSQFHRVSRKRRKIVRKPKWKQYCYAYFMW